MSLVAGRWALVSRIAARAPRPLLDFAYRHRDDIPFRWFRGGLAARDDAAHKGLVIPRGHLAGARLAFDPRGGTALWMGLHEPAVQDFLARELQPGDVAYDIGAHVGYFAVLMARAVGPAGVVHAFEPDPANRGLLERTVALNDLSSIVTTSHLAFGESAGRGSLDAGPDGLTTTVTPGSGDVEVSTLDAYVYEQGAPAPRAILIDTEGAEEPILRGGMRVLREAKPMLVLEHHGLHAVLRALLEPLGYRVSEIDRDHLVARA
jgi:FkbM family methyltransferase